MPRSGIVAHGGLLLVLGVPRAGKILPYLFTLSIQITPFTVIAKGAMSKAQSEKPCKVIAVRAITRRTNPPLSIALAHTIGFRVMVGEYPVLTVEPTVPPCAKLSHRLGEPGKHGDGAWPLGTRRNGQLDRNGHYQNSHSSGPPT